MINRIFPIFLATLLLLFSSNSSAQVQVIKLQPITIEKEPIVEFIPIERIVSGAPSGYKLYFFAGKGSGQPVAGATFKLTPSDGQVSEVIMEKPGIYYTTFIPPYVNRETSIQLGIEVNIEGKRVVKKIQIPIYPSPVASIDIKVTPYPMVIGKYASAGITLRVTDKNTKRLVDLPNISLVSSTGRIENLARISTGVYNATFIPPEKVEPSIAIIAAYDRNDPVNTSSIFALPIHGRTILPIEGPSGIKFTINIGERSFGPFTIDDSQRVEAPVIVPPGATTATVNIISPVQQTQEASLNVPPIKRFMLLPETSAVPTDGISSFDIIAFVVNNDGSPMVGEMINVSSENGVISPFTMVKEGIYLAKYSSKEGGAGLTDRLSFSLATDPQNVETLEVSLLPPFPYELKVSTEPPEISKSDKSLTLKMRVVDRLDKGIAGQEIEVAGLNCDVGKVDDKGDGNYEAGVTFKEGTTVSLTARVYPLSAGGKLHSIVSIPSDNTVKSDSANPVKIEVFALDRFGFLVEGALLNLKIVSGKGYLTAPSLTLEKGRGSFFFYPDKNPGISVIEVSSETNTSYVPILIADEPPPLFTFPVSRATDIFLKKLDQLAKRVELTPKEEVSIVAKPKLEVPISEKGESIVVDVIPKELPADGKSLSLINARVVDEKGNTLKGQKLTFVASYGTIEKVEEKEDGVICATFRAPAKKIADRVNIAITHPEKGLGTFTTIDIVKVSKGKVKVAQEKAPYKVNGKAGVVYPLGIYQLVDNFEVRNASDVSIETLMGVSFGVFGDVSPIKYLSFDLLGYRGYYMVSEEGGRYEAFSNYLDYWNINAGFRYDVTLGSTPLTILPKLGYIYQDVVYFLIPEDTLTWKRKLISCLGTGGELKVGVVPSIDIIASHMAGFDFENFSNISNRTEFKVSFKIYKNIFASLGYGYLYRNLTLYEKVTERKYSTNEETWQTISIYAGYSF